MPQLQDERPQAKSKVTYIEVQNWQQYAEMLTGWAQSVDSFETTVRRVSELPELVYFDIEERHFLVTPRTW